LHALLTKKDAIVYGELQNMLAVVLDYLIGRVGSCLRPRAF